MESLVFLKLGGSLITDKHKASTPRLDVIDRLAKEIAFAWHQLPKLRLVIGHGSGSFGHVVADKYGTRLGVRSPVEWQGFADVWQKARALNQIVIESLVIAGLPVVAFPPSAGVVTGDGKILHWDCIALQESLQHRLIPVLNGDVVFDNVRGGTILSTEEAFAYLARQLKPLRILMAGIEQGVWADYPICKEFIDVITPENIASVASHLKGSSAIDVTGGMVQKVSTMLDLAQSVPSLEILVYSGNEPGNVQETLLGANKGTVIKVG